VEEKAYTQGEEEEEEEKMSKEKKRMTMKQVRCGLSLLQHWQKCPSFYAQTGSKLPLP